MVLTKISPLVSLAYNALPSPALFSNFFLAVASAFDCVYNDDDYLSFFLYSFILFEPFTLQKTKTTFNRNSSPYSDIPW